MALPAAAAAASFWPTTAGGWASLGGSVLGGLSSMFGGGGVSANKARGMLRDQYSEAQRNARQMPSDMVAGFKAAGIHPLYGMGSPAMSPGYMQIGGVSGSDAADIGQGISRAAMAVGDAEDRNVQAKLTALQLERGQLENDLLRSEIATNARSLNPPMPPEVAQMTKGVFADHGGFEPGKAPAHQNLNWNASNATVRGMSEALSNAGLDDGPAQWYYQLTRTVPDALHADGVEVAKEILRAYDQTWWNPKNWSRKKGGN